MVSKTPRTRRDPKTLEFIYKNLCIYSYTFKLQSPAKCSPFDAMHLSRVFSHCSKQFLNSLIVMLFSASAAFISPHPVWQNVSL